MTLPRSVSDVLADHVQFEVECIDRMYLNVFVPELQRTGQVAGFLMRHRGFPIASTALVAPISKQFVADIKDYAAAHDVPVVHFAKGQRKDDVMHEHLAGFAGTDQIVFIGVAQEKAHVFRTERRHNPTTGAPYPWIVSTTAVVNHYYFYGVDDDFGPFFLKFCSYFPYTARLCLLTELRGGSLQVAGQIRVRVATVSAHGRIRRGVTGPQRFGGASGRLAARGWGSVRAVPAA